MFYLFLLQYTMTLNNLKYHKILTYPCINMDFTCLPPARHRVGIGGIVFRNR